MTSQSPRIYIYKITFEEVLYYYYGVHKEKVFDEEYWGSPYTHKWVWDFYTPKKQILEAFPHTDEGWLEANLVEDRLIKPIYQVDRWCLNESCGAYISMEIKRKTGLYCVENKIGIHGYTKEQKGENGRKGSQKQKDENLGIYFLTKEQRIENGKKYGSKAGKVAGNNNKLLKRGICGMSKEERSNAGKKGGKITYDMKIGVHSLTKEQRIENGRKGAKTTTSQKWKCIETGFVANPGNLTLYQNARGIDTSKRIRLS